MLLLDVKGKELSIKSRVSLLSQNSLVYRQLGDSNSQWHKKSSKKCQLGEVPVGEGASWENCQLGDVPVGRNANWGTSASWGKNLTFKRTNFFKFCRHFPK